MKKNFILKIIKKNFKHFFIFIFLALIAGLFNFIIRFYYSKFFNYTFSVFLAQISAMIMFYFLLKYFLYSTDSKYSFIKFTIINIFSTSQVVLVSSVFALYIFPFLNFSFHHMEIAHLLGISSTAMSSFYLHKYWSFKS